MFLGNPALHVSLARSVLHMFCVFICFFPLFSPVDYETDTAAAQFDYGVDHPSYLPEQPGKQPPLLIIPISPMSILSYSCIRIAATATAPITVA